MYIHTNITCMHMYICMYVCIYVSKALANTHSPNTLDTIAPLKQIQVAPHQKQPWFDKNVKARRHKVVQNREQIWHEYPAPDTWKAYKVKRNVYNRLLIYKNRQLITKQVIDSKGNNKKLYKLMAHLSGIRTDNPLPPS